MSQRHFKLSVSDPKLKSSQSSGRFSLLVFILVDGQASVLQARHTRAVVRSPCASSPSNSHTCHVYSQISRLHALLPTSTSCPRRCSASPEAASALPSPMHPWPLAVCPPHCGESSVRERQICSLPCTTSSNGFSFPEMKTPVLTLAPRVLCGLSCPPLWPFLSSLPSVLHHTDRLSCFGWAVFPPASGP